MTYNTRLCGFLMTGAMAASAGAGQAQTAPAAPVAAPVQSAPAQTAPAPSQDVDTVEEITIRAKSTQGAAQRVLKVDPTTAASCNFSVTADNYLEDYIAATTRTKTRTTDLAQPIDPLATDSTATSNAQETYFSQNSPGGADASTDGGGSNLFSNLATTEQTSSCTGLDRNFVAGRATIARRDKTLPEGYAFYDEKKYPEALASFTKAHKKLRDNEGGKEAALMIGKIYLIGPNSAPDVPQAVEWLTKAANAAFNPSITSKDTPAFDPKYPSESLTPISDAAVQLGKIYLTGLGGVEKDPKAARKWFERANYVGFVPAAKTLGDIHFYGYDTARDYKKAVEYYTQAATLGYAPAQYALAEIYYYGEPGIPADLNKALAWYNEAAKLEHPGALYALALAYDSGEGVAADPQKALAFYKAAAVGGNTDAQSAMGTYFYEGGLVPKDAAAARLWFEAAATQGQKDAMFNLGVMTMKGEGGPKDVVKAWVWFRLAKAKGHPNAAAALTALEKQMSPAEKQAAADIVTPKKAG